MPEHTMVGTYTSLQPAASLPGRLATRVPSLCSSVLPARPRSCCRRHAHLGPTRNASESAHLPLNSKPDLRSWEKGCCTEDSHSVKHVRGTKDGFAAGSHSCEAAGASSPWRPPSAPFQWETAPSMIWTAMTSSPSHSTVAQRQCWG